MFEGRAASLVSGVKDDVNGQGLVEYALILTLVVFVVIGALTLFGTSLSALINTVAGKL